MNFKQIKSPNNGEKLYLDICSTADQEHNIACVLSESDMLDMIMCRFRGIPDEDWQDMLGGLELIELELQFAFGITGDVQDLACKVYDRMKETDRKAVRERQAVVGAMV